jgi:hypothetical protein
MTLAIRWSHEAGENARTWPHEPGDWHPIGSGVVEVACKRLAAQRMKQSGMRWAHDGGQAVSTRRGWPQSGRFDEAWALLAATFQVQVTVLYNVLPFRRRENRR